MPEQPLIELRGVVKKYGGLRPLRVQQFTAHGSDTVILSGFDAGAAETFVHLVSGATVPDEGAVLIEGADTREIATDTEWLASLDRFGIVTHRAVFIEGLAVAANMALPLTLSIDPMADDTRAQIESLAELVQIAATRLDVAVGTLTPAERLRVHLARALAPRPRMILLEHPTASLGGESERVAFAHVLRHAASTRQTGFVALTADREFAAASGGTRLKLNAATGDVSRGERWWPWT